MPNVLWILLYFYEELIQEILRDEIAAMSVN